MLLILEIGFWNLVSKRVYPFWILIDFAILLIQKSEMIHICAVYSAVHCVFLPVYFATDLIAKPTVKILHKNLS